MFAKALIAAAFISQATAHIALWDKGMFGLNYPYQADDPVNINWNNNDPVVPLKESDGRTQAQWFGHGMLGYPPKDGDFMILPAGGTYNGDAACNRAFTRLRDPSRTDTLPLHACTDDNPGSLHVMNTFNGSVYDPKWFGGTALAIAYTSDVTSLQPNDLTVISVSHNSVWFRSQDYQIPAGLPPCPPGGCICSWNWIHEANHGEGYPFEIYNILYRCQVVAAGTSSNGTSSTNGPSPAGVSPTGASPTGTATTATSTNPTSANGTTTNGTPKATKRAVNVVQRGAVPVDCTGNPSACVTGPKTPMYLYQADGNNLPHMDNPPAYQDSWGFPDGAQNDIFQPAATPAPATGFANAYATPTNTAGYTAGTPTATALPSGWTALGCFTDQNARALPPGDYTENPSNTISNCTARCDSLGYNYAGVEYGNECWCSNNPNLNPANASTCNSHCPGDQWAMCGGSWAINVFKKASASAPAAYPTASLPSGWSSLGCLHDETRVMSQVYQEDNNVTVPGCIALCQSKGFPYAGTEYANECWCAATIGSYTTAPATDCNMLCTGDNTTFCGGPWRMNAYAATNAPAPSSSVSPTASSTTPSPTATKAISTTAAGTTIVSPTSTTPAGNATTIPSGWTSLGCMKDENRVLSTMVFDQSTNTIPSCIAACLAKGMPYAGVEFGTQCFCSATIGSYNVAPATDCNMPCAGDKNTICGSGWRINVYKAGNAPAGTPIGSSTASPSATTPSPSTTAAPSTTSPAAPSISAPAGWTSLGCHVDSGSPRLLTGFSQTSINNLTPSSCLATCAGKGFTYAAVEYGSECYCGNSFTPAVADASTCNMGCSGQSSSMCGGFYRANVYQNTAKVSSSTAPSSTITSPPASSATGQPTMTVTVTVTVTVTSTPTKTPSKRRVDWRPMQ